MKKTLFILVAISAFALTACNTGPEQETKVDTNPVQVDPVTSALDADTIVNAVRIKNQDLCDTLTAKEQVESCHTKVADAIILSNVNNSVDMKACDGIKEEKTIDQCEILVKANQEKAEQAANAKKDQENVDKIVASGDVSDCKDLEQENYRIQCEANIYMKQAADKNDPLPCSKIKEEFLKEACLSQLSK